MWCGQVDIYLPQRFLLHGQFHSSGLTLAALRRVEQVSE